MIAAFIQNTTHAFFNSFTARKIPLYILAAAFLFTIAPAALLTNVFMKALLSAVFAPLVVELSRAVGLGFLWAFRTVRSRTKSVRTLLQEVNAGNFQDFRTYLNRRRMTSFYPNPRELQGIAFDQLGQALQGTTVTQLTLANHNIGNNCSASLAKALRGTQVNRLVLSHNNIINPVRLAKELCGSQVKALHLESNNIDPTCLEEFGQALKETQVRHLYLGRNGFDVEGIIRLIEALKGTNVAALSLNNLRNYNPNPNLIDINITAEDVIKVRNALKETKITGLYLANCGLNAVGAEIWVEALQGTSVSTLSLEGNDIGNDGATRVLVALKKTQIQTLSLNATNIPYNDIAGLADHVQGTLTPYYMVNMKHLPEHEKAQCVNLPALDARATSDTKLKYAAGIMMKYAAGIMMKLE